MLRNIACKNYNTLVIRNKSSLFKGYKYIGRETQEFSLIRNGVNNYNRLLNTTIGRQNYNKCIQTRSIIFQNKFNYYNTLSTSIVLNRGYMRQSYPNLSNNDKPEPANEKEYNEWLRKMVDKRLVEVNDDENDDETWHHKVVRNNRYFIALLLFGIPMGILLYYMIFPGDPKENYWANLEKNMQEDAREEYEKMQAKKRKR